MASTIQWCGDASRRESSYSSTLHTCDTASYRTYSTAQTEDSYYPAQHFADDHDEIAEDFCFGEESAQTYNDTRISVETYVSGDSSQEFLDETAEAEYELYDLADEPYSPEAIASTPQNFATFFPSYRRLLIHHDDSTLDGNMNLRVDTEVESVHTGARNLMTLFHLRLHDLKTREFSLRRYCRESGREICHSTKAYRKPGSRSGFQKSFSSALAPFLQSPKTSAVPGLKRNDSGYASMFESHDSHVSSPKRAKKGAITANEIMRLEFSNYAQVELRRRGVAAKKRYSFEYWGHEYRWKRTVQPDGNFQEISYHLMRDDKTTPIAHVVPASLTLDQAREESMKGGWVPPCSMWITDDDIIYGSPDIADVVVATGLMVLVDDTIRRRWHSTGSRQTLLPHIELEYIGPKRLIDEVFNRTKSSKTRNTNARQFQPS